MDPVIVPGLATTSLAAIDTYTPPDAAISPIDATTGIDFSFILSTAAYTSWHAATVPPGLLTRRTTPRAFLRSASFNEATIFARSVPYESLSEITPSILTNAILFLERLNIRIFYDSS
jgi:hypothetical protein